MKDADYIDGIAGHPLGCPLALLVCDKRVDIQWDGRTALLAVDQGGAQGAASHAFSEKNPAGTLPPGFVSVAVAQP